MTREKQRHHFVTELRVVHLRTVFVLRFEQHRQQIAFVRTTRAALSNDAKHDAIDLAHGVEVTTMTGRRQTIVEYPLQCCLRRKRLHKTRQYLSDVVCVA